MENNREMRTVTLYSTRGGSCKVETSAATWSELKPLVAENYDLSNLQATESVGKTTLEHEDAVLPKGDFILFLRPVRTKSGMGAAGELRSILGEKAMQRLVEVRLAGKNWADIGIEVFKAGLAYHRDVEEMDADGYDAVDPYGEDWSEEEAERNAEDQRLEEMLESLERGF